MRKEKIWDISPLISSDMAVYPGDVPFSRKISLDFKKGDNLLLSSLTTTLHIGAHADASNHYHAEGVGIEQRDLHSYLGPCQVVHVQLPKYERILPEHIRHVHINTERVLFFTGSFPNFNQWCDDYNSLSPELVDYLCARGVCLIGIDTPSIDPDDSKLLESHQAIYKNDMAILEGLVLENVPEGEYFLVALPLKLKDADASPVRAVLLPPR